MADPQPPSGTRQLTAEQKEKIAANRAAAAERKRRRIETASSSCGPAAALPVVSDSDVELQESGEAASSRTHRKGPASLEDTMWWEYAYLDSLCDMEKIHHIPYIQNLEEDSIRGRVITQSFAGSCSGSAITEKIRNVLVLHQRDEDEVAPPAFDMVQYSSTDNANLSKRCALNMPGDICPAHVFGDILDRLLPDVRERCVERQKSMLRDFAELKNEYKGSEDHPPTMDKYEFEGQKAAMSASYVSDLRGILSKCVFAEKVPCLRCKQLCYVTPRSDPRYRNHRWLELAGTPCPPWSASGSHNGHLDESALPELVWVYSTKYHCTNKFDLAVC